MPASIFQFPRLNFWAWLGMLAQNDIGIIPFTGVPVAGTSGTGAGKAGKGCLLVNVSTGIWYTNTGTKASPTWTVVGTQA